MSRQLTNDIRASISTAQGGDYQGRAIAARDSFLQAREAAQQEEEALPSAVDVINAINERTAGMSYDEAQQYKISKWNLVENTADFRGLDFKDRSAVQARFFTALSDEAKANFESLDPSDPSNANMLKMYGQYTGMRNGESVNLNGWDSFGKNMMRWSSVAGIGLGIADATTDRNLKDEMIGTDATEMERIMLDVATRMNPAEAADYKRGKVAGAITGIGLDMAATVALGHITGVTAMASRLGGAAAKGITAASKGSVLAKMTAASAKVLIPNSIEAGFFIGEEGVNRWVNNELDTSEDIQRFVDDLPGTFMKGLAYSTFGEIAFKAIGGAVSRGARSASKQLGKQALSSADLPPSVKAALTSDGKTTSRRLINDLVSSGKWTPEHDARRMTSLLTDGYRPKEAKAMVDEMREAAFLRDPDRWNDEVELTRHALWDHWKAEAEVIDGGDFRIKSVLGQELDGGPQVVKNDPKALGEFFQNNYTAAWNKQFDEIRLATGYSTKAVTVDLLPATGKANKVKIGDTAAVRIWRPVDEVTNVTETQKLVDTIFPDSNLKVEVLEHSQYYGKLQNKQGIIYVPKTIKSSAQSEQAMVGFFSQMKQAGTDLSRPMTFGTKKLSAMLMDTTDVIYNRDFFKKIGKRINVTKTPTGYTAKLDGEAFQIEGKIATFGTSKEALEVVGKAAHIDSYGGMEGIQEVLGRRGIKLEMSDNGYKAYINNELYRTDLKDFNEVLADPVLRPGLPAEKKPEFFELSVSGSNKGVSFQQDNVPMTARMMSQDMKMYEDVPRGYYKVPEEAVEGVTVFTNGYKAVVTVPDVGYVREFATVTEAKNYLRDFDQRYKRVVNRASEAGLVARPVPGGWVVANDLETMHFKTVRDVDKFLARDSKIRAKDLVPDSDYEESVTSVRKAISESFDEGRFKVQSQAAAKEAKMSKRGRIFGVYEDVWKQSHTKVRDGGNLNAIRGMDLLHQAMRRIDGEQKMVQAELNKVFKGATDEELHFMGMLFSRETDSLGWAKHVDEMNEAMGTNIKFDARLQGMLQSARDLFDSGGVQFGVSGRKWVTDYSPILADKTDASMFETMFQEGDDFTIMGHDKFRQVLNNNIPPQDQPFFMYLRGNQTGTGVAETNIRRMLETYYDVGIRYKRMAEPIAQLKTLVKRGADGQLGIPEKDLIVIKSVMDSMNGRVDNRDAALAAHALRVNKTKQRMALLGKGADGKAIQLEEFMVETGGDLASISRRLEHIHSEQSYGKMFSSTVNGALMAWNLRMPIRNVSQVITNLMPVNGAKYVNRAIADVLGDKTLYARKYADAIENGIIVPEAGKSFKQIRSGGDALDYNLKTGMMLFRKSDDWTRVIAMRSTELRVADAIQQAKIGMADGTFDATKFLRNSSADLMDESVQLRMLDMLQGKNTVSGVIDEKGIQALAQREITELTMYAYNPELRPQKFKGGFGQIAGKMGTWPVAYFNLFKKGLLTRGTKFVIGTFMAQAAMGVLYNDMLDMNGVPYTPLGNMSFTGGPGLEGFPRAIQGATQAISGFTNGTSTGLQSVGKMAKAASWTIPFYKQYNSVTHSIEAIQDSEYREGALYLLGANPNWNQPGLARFYHNLEPDRDYDVQDWWTSLGRQGHK